MPRPWARTTFFAETWMSQLLAHCFLHCLLICGARFCLNFVQWLFQCPRLSTVPVSCIEYVPGKPAFTAEFACHALQVLCSRFIDRFTDSQLLEAVATWVCSKLDCFCDLQGTLLCLLHSFFPAASKRASDV